MDGTTITDLDGRPRPGQLDPAATVAEVKDQDQEAASVMSLHEGIAQPRFGGGPFSGGPGATHQPGGHGDHHRLSKAETDYAGAGSAIVRDIFVAQALQDDGSSDQAGNERSLSELDDELTATQARLAEAEKLALGSTAKHEAEHLQRLRHQLEAARAAGDRAAQRKLSQQERRYRSAMVARAPSHARQRVAELRKREQALREESGRVRRGAGFALAPAGSTPATGAGFESHAWPSSGDRLVDASIGLREDTRVSSAQPSQQRRHFNIPAVAASQAHRIGRELALAKGALSDSASAMADVARELVGEILSPRVDFVPRTDSPTKVPSSQPTLAEAEEAVSDLLAAMTRVCAGLEASISDCTGAATKPADAASTLAVTDAATSAVTELREAGQAALSAVHVASAKCQSAAVHANATRMAQQARAAGAAAQVQLLRGAAQRLRLVVSTAQAEAVAARQARLKAAQSGSFVGENCTPELTVQQRAEATMIQADCFLLSTQLALHDKIVRDNLTLQARDAQVVSDMASDQQRLDEAVSACQALGKRATDGLDRFARPIIDSSGRFLAACRISGRSLASLERRLAVLREHQSALVQDQAMHASLAASDGRLMESAPTASTRLGNSPSRTAAAEDFLHSSRHVVAAEAAECAGLTALGLELREVARAAVRTVRALRALVGAVGTVASDLAAATQQSQLSTSRQMHGSQPVQTKAVKRPGTHTLTGRQAHDDAPTRPFDTGVSPSRIRSIQSQAQALLHETLAFRGDGATAQLGQHRHGRFRAMDDRGLSQSSGQHQPLPVVESESTPAWLARDPYSSQFTGVERSTPPGELAPTPRHPFVGSRNQGGRLSGFQLGHGSLVQKLGIDQWRVSSAAPGSPGMPPLQAPEAVIGGADGSLTQHYVDDSDDLAFVNATRRTTGDQPSQGQAHRTTASPGTPRSALVRSPQQLMSQEASVDALVSVANHAVTEIVVGVTPKSRKLLEKLLDHMPEPMLLQAVGSIGRAAMLRAALRPAVAAMMPSPEERSPAASPRQAPLEGAQHLLLTSTCDALQAAFVESSGGDMHCAVEALRTCIERPHRFASAVAYACKRAARADHALAGRITVRAELGGKHRPETVADLLGTAPVDGPSPETIVGIRRMATNHAQQRHFDSRSSARKEVASVRERAARWLAAAETSVIPSGRLTSLSSDSDHHTPSAGRFPISPPVEVPAYAIQPRGRVAQLMQQREGRSGPRRGNGHSDRSPDHPAGGEAAVPASYAPLRQAIPETDRLERVYGSPAQTYLDSISREGSYGGSRLGISLSPRCLRAAHKRAVLATPRGQMLSGSYVPPSTGVVDAMSTASPRERGLGIRSAKKVSSKMAEQIGAELSSRLTKSQAARQELVFRHAETRQMVASEIRSRADSSTKASRARLQLRRTVSPRAADSKQARAGHGIRTARVGSRPDRRLPTPTMPLSHALQFQSLSSPPTPKTPPGVKVQDGGTRWTVGASPQAHFSAD